jgi:hypothetical protein
MDKIFNNERYRNNKDLTVIKDEYAFLFIEKTKSDIQKMIIEYSDIFNQSWGDIDSSIITFVYNHFGTRLTYDYKKFKNPKDHDYNLNEDCNYDLYNFVKNLKQYMNDVKTITELYNIDLEYFLKNTIKNAELFSIYQNNEKESLRSIDVFF